MEAGNSTQNIPAKVEALCWKVWDYREDQTLTLTLRTLCWGEGDRQIWFVIIPGAREWRRKADVAV